MNQSANNLLICDEAEMQDQAQQTLQPLPSLPTLATLDMVCLSHLRWDFVYQRPQQLLSRCARERRVFFIEEPAFDSPVPHLEIDNREGRLWIVVPHLPDRLDGSKGLTEEAIQRQLQELMDQLLLGQRIRQYVLWYYTPMALDFSRHLEPLAVVYDCMDELSAFKGASPLMKEREAELLRRADLVFTGGQSLYEAKREMHPQVHLFPSSVDAAHFAKARQSLQDPADQAGIAHPRFGFFGVIDERMDLELIDGIAAARPDWQLVMIGPVVKIDPAQLPRRPNIHYLGGKAYQDLPAYIAGWSVALLPFAINDATRFISPTKTPEYLAAGKPIVSTPIRDVVNPYGKLGLVRIAATVEEFTNAIKSALEDDIDEQVKRGDELLAQMSWDLTWRRMAELIGEAVGTKEAHKMSRFDSTEANSQSVANDRVVTAS
jgi:glycosyltransferase involved in cell wall biosynthesis